MAAMPLVGRQGGGVHEAEVGLREVVEPRRRKKQSYWAAAREANASSNLTILSQ